jgi:hypothetical protein
MKVYPLFTRRFSGVTEETMSSSIGIRQNADTKAMIAFTTI